MSDDFAGVVLFEEDSRSMTVRCHFLLVEPAAGWTVLRSVHGGLTLGSPKEAGTLHLSCVVLPELGDVDVAKLWRRTERGPPRGHEKAFDLTEWTSGNVCGIAFSTVHPAAPSGLLIPEGILLRRDWTIGSGKQVADAFYTATERPDILYINPTDKRDRRTATRWPLDGVKDLLDCEAMIRALRWTEDG